MSVHDLTGNPSHRHPWDPVQDVGRAMPLSYAQPGVPHATNLAERPLCQSLLFKDSCDNGGGRLPSGKSLSQQYRTALNSITYLLVCTGNHQWKGYSFQAGHRSRSYRYFRSKKPCRAWAATSEGVLEATLVQTGSLLTFLAASSLTSHASKNPARRKSL